MAEFNYVAGCVPFLLNLIKDVSIHVENLLLFKTSFGSLIALRFCYESIFLYRIHVHFETFLFLNNT